MMLICRSCEGHFVYIHVRRMAAPCSRPTTRDNIHYSRRKPCLKDKQNRTVGHLILQKKRRVWSQSSLILMSYPHKERFIYMVLSFIIILISLLSSLNLMGCIKVRVWLSWFFTPVMAVSNFIILTQDSMCKSVW